jgi:hypothetical protein
MPLIFAILLLIAFSASAQHQDHEHHTMPDESTPAMTHSFSLSLPMNRNGSGTGWLPDATPMYAWMKHKDRWSYMMHGAVFVRQNFQNLNNNYKNGGRQFDVPTWMMGMAQYRTHSNGLFLVRAMMSLDPFTVGGSGYPLLFQTGETYKGMPLVNRQHPHDLFSELAVGYTHKITNDVDVSVYLAYPGEPALGPTAFMHRISSLNNPDAPLGHHWQDATHITFGVATLGIRYKKLKLEGSSFTGEEPDEERYGFDKPTFNSYSYRLSYAPTKNFVLQVSRASIIDVDRTTASVIFARQDLTATLAWGLNQEGDHHTEHSVLLESNWQPGRVALYGRYEYVEKSPHELQLTSILEESLPIHALTLGTNYRLGSWFGTNTAVGAQATLNKVPQVLDQSYGNTPFSLEIYLRIIPAMMR